MFRKAAMALVLLAVPFGARAAEACGKNHFILLEPCQVEVLRSWRWTPAGELQVPRLHHRATLLADGRILVTGGDPSAEIYDPATGVSHVTAPMSVARPFSHEALRLPDGRVIVSGAYTATNTPGQLALSGAVEIFDPPEERWTLAAPMLVPRTAHSMTLLLDGRVLVAGGVDNGDRTLHSAEIYDPATNRWRFTGPLAEGRLGHTATRLGDGTVLLAGGRIDDFWEVITGSTERYDPWTEKWTALEGLRAARERHTAILLSDGDVLVVGGDAKGGDWEPLSSAIVERFGAAGWNVAAPMVRPRVGHAIARVAGDMALVTGGRDWQWLGWFGYGGAEAYNPSTGQWSWVADMAVPRSHHTATALPDGRVVVIGGQSTGLAGDPAMRSIEVFGPSPNATLGVARRAR